MGGTNKALEGAGRGGNVTIIHLPSTINKNHKNESKKV